MLIKHKLKELLNVLYAGDNYLISLNLMEELLDKWGRHTKSENSPLSEKDCMLITYGDGIWEAGKNPLRTLREFLNKHCHEVITNVHLLPIFPYTSDDGFSVSDYNSIDPALGNWKEVEALSESAGIMLDAVINHSSRSHQWFQRCLAEEVPYKEYYIACDKNQDYSLVTRPRTLPLLTKFDTANGEKWYWTTFSNDQVDLNFASPYLLKEVMEILLLYASRGARFIRLDAIGFAWKKLGTSCMHLRETHALVKLMRLILDEIFPGTYIITETNVPHQDNISYFGCGDEAHLVYQFPLPPLVLYTMLSGDTTRLSNWAAALEDMPLAEGCTYFNFLASHDGIGVRPVDGILKEEEKQLLFDTVVQNGGKISYKQNDDGSRSPYELNITYMDALTPPEEAHDEIRIQRFLAAQAVMLSLQGVPGIYYHSLLGSRNWYEGLEESGISRKINREKLETASLELELSKAGTLRRRVFENYLHLLKTRSSYNAFSPEAKQKILTCGTSVFALERINKKSGQRVQVFINVTGAAAALTDAVCGFDMLGTADMVTVETLAPYQVLWLLVPKTGRGK